METAAQRPFLVLPPVLSVSRAQALANLEQQEAQEAEARIQADQDKARHEEILRLIDHSLAFYSIPEQKIYVISTNIGDFMESTGTTVGPLLGSVARCVVAHELTHALQHQYAHRSPPKSDEEQASLLAMWEGQAHLVAQRSCADPVAWQLLESSQRLDVLSSLEPEDPIARYYGYGFAFMSTLERRGGIEATWNALLLPLCSWPRHAAMLAFQRGEPRSPPVRGAHRSC